MKNWKRKKKTASTEDRLLRWLRCGLACTVLMLCLTGMGVQAQEKQNYALIYGTVWNANDLAVSGVPIKIQRVGDKNPKWELVSDRRGEFAQRVPAGENDYLVVADIKTPKGGTKPQTKVHIYKNERVDISLHLAE
ncbi:MAG TPA: hypothetical protein VGL89_19655 [Candidatus Koribacter sp.]